MSTSIPVFFTFDEAYILPATVAFTSLLENANPEYQYILHVVTCGEPLSRQGKEKLRSVVGKYPNATLHFKHVDADFAEQWGKVRQAHFSKHIFLKLIPATLFPEHDWIICSDVDVVFEGDISEVLVYSTSDYFLAGVRNLQKLAQFIDRQPYDDTLKDRLKGGVGAGLLVYNLKKIRNDNMEPVLLRNLDRYAVHVTQPEQDILNITFSGQIQILPLRFMFCTYLYSAVRPGSLDLSVSGNWSYYLRKQYRDYIQPDARHSEEDVRVAFDAPVQVHFAGPKKPWTTLFCYRKLSWLKYLWKAGYLTEHMATNEIRNIVRFVRKNIRRFGDRVRERVRRLRSVATEERALS